MKRVAVLLAVALSICITTSCSNSTGKAEAKEDKTIRISLCIWPGHAHAFVAERKGLFERNKVDVELVLVKEQIDSLQPYKNGEVDGIFTLVPDVIIANSENIPTKIVYISDHSDTGDVITGRAGYNSLADLKNRTVSFEGLDAVDQPNLMENAEAMQKTDGSTSLHRSGEYIGRFFLNRGQLSQEPNMDEMIEPRFINKLAGK